ncbi:MAG TPA: MotB family protein [Rhodopseudomonas sp.]|uniref:MotB family protein n=1 Tax=Rhodopseudomonas sp. TaxID=1078 RepID=UPI002ED8A12A
MAEQERPELIIIRRRSSLDAEEKSGVWKIAYADFMTAMMAFFLVMWLINATNPETRESVAAYFNPIKLTDSTPDRKGINDPKRVDPGKADDGDNERPQPEPDKAAEPAPRPQPAQARDEAALFRDPYAVLSDIAGGPPRLAPGAGTPDAARKDGMKGGEAYRDPFDPISWPMAQTSPLDDKALGRKEAGSLPFDDAAAALIEGQGRRPSQGRPDATVAAAPDDAPAGAAPPSSEPRQDKPRPVGLFADEATKTGAPGNRLAAARGDAAPAANAAGKLQASISAALATLGAARPQAEVRETSEGLLISLTDDVNYGMFATGSAEPSPGLIRALDKITPLIAQNRGQLIVRGHTDNRAYRSAEYDNWRLSTARAHMAYYMLIRGGLDARRIERIEGYADRRPKDPNDPSAAPNRRIELLIRAPTP